MDDGLTLSRSQHEESRTARVIRSTVFLFNLFIRWIHKSISLENISIHSISRKKSGVKLPFTVSAVEQLYPFRAHYKQ